MRRLITLSALAAALAALCGSAQAQSNDRYCLIQSHNNAKNCGFVTLAQCEQSKGSPGDVCEPNNGTTSQSRRRR